MSTTASMRVVGPSLVAVVGLNAHHLARDSTATRPSPLLNSNAFGVAWFAEHPVENARASAAAATIETNRMRYSSVGSVVPVRTGQALLSRSRARADTLSYHSWPTQFAPAFKRCLRVACLLGLPRGPRAASCPPRGVLSRDRSSSDNDEAARAAVRIA